MQWPRPRDQMKSAIPATRRGRDPSVAGNRLPSGESGLYPNPAGVGEWPGGAGWSCPSRWDRRFRSNPEENQVTGSRRGPMRLTRGKSRPDRRSDERPWRRNKCIMKSIRRLNWGRVENRPREAVADGAFQFLRMSDWIQSAKINRHCPELRPSTIQAMDYGLGNSEMALCPGRVELNCSVAWDRVTA